jgi:hypothetical protein
MVKKVTKKDKITLGKLAGMMARGFGEVNDKIDGTNERIDKGFEIVNDRLGKIEDRLGQVEFGIFELKTKESITDKEVGMIKRRMDNLERRQLQK